MEQFRLEITPTLARHMAYDKFGAQPIRLLVLEGDYWVDQACARAAEAMGWEVARCPVKMVGTMSHDMVKGIFQAIITHKPDFVLSVNLSGMDVKGMFARFLADLHIPHVTWFVDCPRAIMAGNQTSATPYTVALTWEAAYVDFLRECGFSEVLVVPLGLDDTLFKRPPLDTHLHPPTFVGDSMIPHARKEWQCVEDCAGLNTVVNGAFDMGRVVRELFGQGVETVLGDTAPPLDDEALYHADRIFFIEGTRRLRRSLVDALAPQGLYVRGDKDWQSVTDQCGPPLNYALELAPFYQNCPVNLNSTSVQMATTVNQRVFDCPAAGGFLLTDNQSVLQELFDVEHEVATYDTLEEAREKMCWFLEHPMARRAIIERAQKRIYGEHTYRHRLEAIATHVRGIYGG